MTTIHSKELLYKKKGKKYKAYLLFGNTYTDVADLGFTEDIDLATTRGTSDSSCLCSYVILNGKLFFTFRSNSTTSFTQIGTSNEWTAITGYWENKSGIYGLGICNDVLNKITNNSSTSCSTSGTPIGISGYYYFRSNSQKGYPYVACKNNQNKLYFAIVTENREQILGRSPYFDLPDNYKDIKMSGFMPVDYYINGYALIAPQYYGIAYTPSALASPSVIDISGFTDATSSQSCVGFLIKSNNYLSQANGVKSNLLSAKQVSGFFGIAPTSSTVAMSGYPLILGTDDKLYTKTSNSTTTGIAQIGTDAWKYITGYFGSADGYAINQQNELHRVYKRGGGAGLTSKLLDNCVKVWGAGTPNYPALAICEA